MSEDVSVGTSLGSYPSIDEAYANVVEKVLQWGHQASTFDSRTNQVEVSKELIASSFTLTDPLDRILYNSVRRFNMASAVGRFALMIAATDDVERFAVYDPRVRNYSDNGKTLDGSDYGKRLFRAGEHYIDQIEAIIEQLKVPGSRRAAATIYGPEDLTRKSRDIPCVLDIHYMIRGGRLISLTHMRSNNLYSLVPYNVFEFTMLAEIIASTLRVELGPYVHISDSLHIYDRDMEKVSGVKSGVTDSKYRYPMPRMPSNPAPLEQARLLAKLEEELFTRNKNNQPFDYPSLYAKGRVLSSYWRPFYDILLSTYFIRQGKTRIAETIACSLPDHFRLAILPEVAAIPIAPVASQDHKGKQLSLDGNPVSSTFSRMKKQLSASPDEKRKSAFEFVHFCRENKVLPQEAKVLYEKCIADVPVAIAARKEQTIREKLDAELRSIRHLD